MAVFALARFPAALVRGELGRCETLVAVLAHFLLRLGRILGILIAKLFMRLQLPGHAPFATELAVHGAAIAIRLVRREHAGVKALETEGALQTFLGFHRLGCQRDIGRGGRFSPRDGRGIGRGRRRRRCVRRIFQESLTAVFFIFSI